MSRYERLFATMRRWAAVQHCLRSMDGMRREVIEAFFMGTERDKELAKRLKITLPRVAQIRLTALRVLTDMLIDGDD